MVDRCMMTDSSLWPQPHHPWPPVSGDTAGATTRGVLPHTPVNHTVFSYYHRLVRIEIQSTICLLNSTPSSKNCLCLLKKKSMSELDLSVDSSQDLFLNRSNWLIMVFLLSYVLYVYFDQLHSQLSTQSIIFHCKCQENTGSPLSGLHLVYHSGGNCIMHKRCVRSKMAAPITHHDSANLTTTTNKVKHHFCTSIWGAN